MNWSTETFTIDEDGVEIPNELIKLGIFRIIRTDVKYQKQNENETRKYITRIARRAEGRQLTLFSADRTDPNGKRTIYDREGRY